MKLRRVRLMTAFFVMTLALAAGKQPDFAFDRFLSTFYLAPQPDRVPEFLATLSTLHLAEKKNSRPESK